MPDKTEAAIRVDYRPDDHGRLEAVFHLADGEGKEIVLDGKRAVKLAKSILKIAARCEVK